MLSSISKSLRGVAIGVAAVLVSYAPASAVPVAVTYNMTFAFFSPAANQNVLTGTGSWTVEFANGTSGGHVGPGPLHLLSGTAMLANSFSIPLGSGIMFTGMQLVVFPGSGMGTATAGGLFNLATVGHIASGMIHCAGAFCGFAGFTPSVSMNLTSGPQAVNLNNPANLLLGFPSVGPQNFNALGVGSMTPQGGTLAATVTGTEVSRQIVPEPGTGALLGLGLAGLGIAMTTLRRRGRS